MNGTSIERVEAGGWLRLTKSAHSRHPPSYDHAAVRPVIPDFRRRCEFKPAANWKCADKADLEAINFYGRFCIFKNRLFDALPQSNYQTITGGAARLRCTL